MTQSRSGFFAGALSWLRAGYPDGIPARDRIPLVAILRHRLSAAELDQIVTVLIDQYDLSVDHANVSEVIRKVALQHPSDEDISRVAARLAAAGWPLSSGQESVAPEPGSAEPVRAEPVRGESSSVEHDAGRTPPTRPAFMRAVIGWLTAGYPAGVPSQDYIPLLALLRRRLSDDEVGWVATRLVAETGSFDRADVGVLITKITEDMPSEADIARVQAHVESAGLLSAPPETVRPA